MLEGWLLSLASDTLRHHPWVEDMEDLCTLGTLLRRGQIRRYWEWLTDVIKIHCAQNTCVDGDWQRHVVASRVAIALYSGCGLSSLVRRVDAWHHFSVPLNEAGSRFFAADEQVERTCPCPLLDDSMGVIRGDVHVQHLATLPALVAEGNDMNNCAGHLLDEVEARLILVFSLRGRNSGSRATGTVAADENGLWQVGELNGPSNQPLVATDVRHQVMRNLCLELEAVGSRHPRVAECLMAGSTSKRRRELHAQRTATHGRIQQFVPGIGSRDPALVIQRLWTRCASE
ncbi:hypothetical protein [Novilysobacter avium]|uniref:Uncharacterized protein n=1 Tax=Novilysobacter avium TaxID=2781023 RepID=A0A7S6ZU82_9GAMM|nr:hypothetical protein [Lysobacter avium]QOW21785.1 hypothetical protein INQ42_11220 [Lysobacter avium]